jgi:hypothetical protein
MSQEIQGFRFRTSSRVPYGEKVRLRFGRSGGSVTAVCSDLSIEGMFVATRESRPVCTVVEFEIDGSQQQVARGLGDVVWSRSDAIGPGRHAGLGVQFRYVDPTSRELIAEMVRRRNEAEGRREEADESAAAPPAGADAPAGVPEPAAGGSLAAAGQETPPVTGVVQLAGRGPSESAGPLDLQSFDAALEAQAENGARRPTPPWVWIVVVALALATIVLIVWGLQARRGGTPAPVQRPAAGADEAGPAMAGLSVHPTVVSVEVESADAMSSVLTITFQEPPEPSLVNVGRLEGPARLQVRVRGASQAPVASLRDSLVGPMAATIESSDGGPELHLVFPLSSESVRADWRLEGNRLLLRFLLNE